jgi:hypothetical protein
MGRTSAVADETLQAGAVGGRDADAGVQAEPTAVIPGQHTPGLVGLHRASA